MELNLALEPHQNGNIEQIELPFSSFDVAKSSKSPQLSSISWVFSVLVVARVLSIETGAFGPIWAAKRLQSEHQEALHFASPRGMILELENN